MLSSCVGWVLQQHFLNVCIFAPLVCADAKFLIQRRNYIHLHFDNTVTVTATVWLRIGTVVEVTQNQKEVRPRPMKNYACKICWSQPDLWRNGEYEWLRGEAFTLISKIRKGFACITVFSVNCQAKVACYVTETVGEGGFRNIDDAIEYKGKSHGFRELTFIILWQMKKERKSYGNHSCTNLMSNQWKNSYSCGVNSLRNRNKNKYECWLEKLVGELTDWLFRVK